MIFLVIIGLFFCFGVLFNIYQEAEYNEFKRNADYLLGLKLKSLIIQLRRERESLNVPEQIDWIREGF